MLCCIGFFKSSRDHGWIRFNEFIYKNLSKLYLQCEKTMILDINSTVNRCVCVYSNSRNDVPRVAQRYGTIAAHNCVTRPCVRPRCVCSILRARVQFCRFDKRTPPPTFSDTATTDRHSDTTIFQLRAHWVRISWSIGSEKSFGHVPPVGVEPSTYFVQGEHPIH